jgi:hypothetical protein
MSVPQSTLRRGRVVAAIDSKHRVFKVETDDGLVAALAPAALEIVEGDAVTVRTGPSGNSIVNSTTQQKGN